MGARQRLIDKLKNQFEPDADGFIYRVDCDAQGFRVNAAERDRCVAALERQAGWVALVGGEWVWLGLVGGASAVLVLVFHVYSLWAFVAVALAAKDVQCRVVARFFVLPGGGLRGRPILRLVSARERWKSGVMRRPWWGFALNITLSTACLADELRYPNPFKTVHRIIVAVLIVWCLIGYIDLAGRIWFGSRRFRS